MTLTSPGDITDITLPPLHLPNRLVDSEREQISDAAAVYFIMPSPENIERLCSDFKAQLYDNYYLNFIMPVPRDMLEKLANAAVACNCSTQISKVSSTW